MILVKTPTMIGYVSRFGITNECDYFFVFASFVDGSTIGVARFKSYGEAEHYLNLVYGKLRDLTPTIVCEEVYIL